MLLQLDNVCKSIGLRDLFDTGKITVYSGERIGVVGANGCGKTTLLDIIAGSSDADSGKIVRNCSIAYFRQFDDCCKVGDELRAAQWNVTAVHEHSSGGERVRNRLAAVLAQQPDLLLLDEPTANLDTAGIELLQEELQQCPGALVLISHDRELLDNVCTGIWEITSGKINRYPGNYSDYCREKQRLQLEKQRAVDNWQRERKRLRCAIQETTERSAVVRRAPARMGNSEARLHKMGDQRAKGNIDKAASTLRTRLERLERPDGPDNEPVLIFDMLAQHDIYSRYVVTARNLRREYDGKLVLDGVDFNIVKGAKIALTGCNGCGKTTLLRAVINRDDNVTVNSRARIGYLDQSLQGLNEEQSILDNVRAGSVYSETFVRTLLARLKFRTDNVHKKVKVLSGGERVRALLAKIMAGNCNFLVFDEPTNYLDIPSLEAVESVLADFGGTMLFTSHDRQFVNNVATEVWHIADGKIRAC